MGYFAMSKAGGNTTTMHLLAKDVGSLGVISSISLHRRRINSVYKQADV
jgi:hypothetical protein